MFNFYHPDYIPAGPLAQAGLLGPEFEITNASSLAGFAEYSKFFIINGFGQTSSNKALWIQPDYTYYLGLAGTPTQMLDALDLVLCAGSMNPTVKAQIVASITKMTLNGNIPAQNFERLRRRSGSSSIRPTIWCRSKRRLDATFRRQANAPPGIPQAAGRRDGRR